MELSATLNGSTIVTNYVLGYTNNSGYFTSSGTEASADVGAWTETYTINGTTIANISFFVLTSLPTVALLDTTNPALDSSSGANPVVGDSIAVHVTSAAAARYQPVTFTYTQNGTAYSSFSAGKTDSNGNFATTGTEGASDAGSWTEQ